MASQIRQSSTCSTLSMDELNAVALEHFVYTPVSRGMISYLATAAYNVIQCDPTMMPPPPVATTTAGLNNSNNSRLPPTPPKTPPPRAVPAEDAGLPTLEEFITQLVVSSNVQVPTLMSTLVYLNRLKSRLQPMAKGLRCTTHRIFLASLILAAKYLNDSSPKNKHWANYSVMGAGAGAFGFSRTEVNLMEKQLLSLLDWDLRITEADLCRELDVFLAPIRLDVAARHERRQRRRAAQLLQQQQLQLQKAEEEQQALQQMQQMQRRRREMEEDEEAAAAWIAAQTAIVYATPPATPGGDRNRSRTSSRQDSPDSLPGLSSSNYASSSSSRSIGSSHSYGSSLSLSSRGCSGATTPLSSAGGSGADAPYIYDGVLHTGSSGSLYEPPVEIVLEGGHGQPHPARMAMQQQQKTMMVPQQQLTKQKSLLPYEISPEELRDLQEGGSRVKRMRGMLGRVFGSGVAVR